ncbi:PAS domain-containing hybrid sensor histidine kinase/response regulator [Acuticoccus sediminis]|uniref:PAS domain-containing hybrid sensor histidine kinase/response regulator n=1 Tax=Acuticoccus sediminis TaxID=2184697 RepID=UPI001CFD6624|nr:PAS domain-containing hybrid sensor histidine kinase/response regulator [Acuticoccus sediminis]
MARDDPSEDPGAPSHCLAQAGPSLAPATDPVRRSAVMVAVGLIADALFLGIDLAKPELNAVAVLYSIPVLAAFWLPSPRATLILAVAGSLCSVIGYAMTPVTPPAGPVETVIYRAAALVVLWGTALLAIRHQVSRSIAEQSTAAGRHQAALLQVILDTAPDALIVIDTTGVIQSFSRSAELLFGYTAAEAVGRNVSMLMTHGDREAHGGYLERYLRTGERRIIGVGRVVKGQTKDGRTMPVELSVGEARVANHRIFIGFIRDLSARMRIEEELRQAHKMEAIGQLTGGIAHDFNNLLFVISGNLELIEARPDRPDPTALKEAREAIDLGTQLTSQLLSFGRKQSLDPREIDLAELVKGVASMLSRTLGNDIEIVVDVRGTPGRAVADTAQLQTALLNLAINARDAMESGGRLVFSVFDGEIDASYALSHPDVRLGRYVVVQVADNGCGMTEEVRDHAFEPFFTTRAQSTGNGLGLSMVYGFVKQSKGHVEIDSALGRGTTVTLYLPRADQEEHAGDPSRAEMPAAARGKGEMILVVEDDARVRRIATTRLRELGYRTVEAGSGTDGLHRLRTIPEVDLMFTDIVMRDGMSGFELARRAWAERPGLRVLVTTGYAGPDLVSWHGKLQLSADQILRKPYSMDQLARAVRAALDTPA